jgi:hypothetical protein
MRRSLVFSSAGFAAAALMALATGPLWAAGTSKPGQGGKDQPAQSDCQAQPNRKDADKSDNGTNSVKKLDRCGGVLQPPDVNDQGLVKPAPETGKMPIIKPGQVPELQPKQE